MPSALGVGGRQVVAEEDELLRLVHADDARQQVRDAAVGDEAAPHEHLDELRGVGRDHEVGREHEHRAAAGRGAVERDDDRLLAVVHRLHQPLEAERASCRSRRPPTIAGAPSGFGLPARLRHREVGAGEAEVGMQQTIPVEFAEQVLAVCHCLDHSGLVEQGCRVREAALRATDDTTNPPKA